MTRGALVAALASAICAGTPVVPAAADLTSAPVFSPSTLDVVFGTVPPFEVSALSVEIRNEGDAPLVLRELRTYSDVVRAALDTTPIPPGGRTDLRVALFPAARGPFDSKIVFRTNDPRAPRVALVVRAYVAARCEVVDSLGAFGVRRPGDAVPGAIAVRCREDGGVRIAGVDAVPACVRANARSAADSLGATISLSVAPDAPRGAVEGHVRIALAGARTDTLRVPFVGEVAGRWRVSPFPFRPGVVAHSPAWPPFLLCERAVEGASRVLRATTDVPQHIVRIEPIEEGRSYRVRLIPAAGWKRGAFSGTVRIETDDPKERVIEVPTRLLVGKARGQ
jgi:hypothetical protein